MDENYILVTGFGPFSDHKINASWEAVRLLKNYKIDGYNILTKEIPVSYKSVQEIVPMLWNEYKPSLVIHVGVSNFAKEITLETTAHSTGYIKKDCEGFTLADTALYENNIHPEYLNTCIDTEGIIKELHGTSVKYCTSNNTGRYLCEFIYYTSLRIDAERTLFIHVPCINNPFSVRELAGGIFKIICCALSQINKKIKS